ncbi:MAG: DUF302 domain-containing protein [Acidimicrobiia bacterium]|nr:DUF302 domain-containing protein [Acidimicrobiia bacterium]
MEQRPYGLKVVLDTDMETAEARTREALAAEGFGVLTEIDMAATLKARLDVDRAPYKILGACNPPLANKALASEIEVGLLLPCNVAVYEADEGTVVQAMDPGIMSELSESAGLAEVAAEARQRIERALATLEG